MSFKNDQFLQWPPEVSTQGSAEKSLGEMFKITHKILEETKRDSRRILREATSDDLIFQIIDTDLPGYPFRILHGIENYEDPKKPLLIEPQRTLVLLNECRATLALQLGRILTYSYAIDSWETLLLAQEIKEQGISTDEETEDVTFEYKDAEPEDEDDEDESDEPWHVDYQWEQPAEEEEEEGVLATDDDAFMDFLTHHRPLRELYLAIITGQLTPDSLYLPNNEGR